MRNLLWIEIVKSSDYSVKFTPYKKSCLPICYVHGDLKEIHIVQEDFSSEISNTLHSLI